jgi:hypothetical protein
VDEASVHTSSNRLFKSSENTTTLWSIPDGLQDDHKPGSDILALSEGLNEMPEWLRTPLRRFLRLKQRNWPAKTLSDARPDSFSTGWTI